MTVRAYLVRGEKLGPVARTVDATSDPVAVVAEALIALFAGPEKADSDLGLGTTVPAGTRLLSVSLRDSVATIDVSREFESGGGSLSMLLRVAQVIYTATQFDGVDRVAFKIDGKAVRAIGGEGVIVDPPVGRKDFEGQAPAILLESPLPGEVVTSPLTISGTANVFEAQFHVTITDPEGLIIAEQDVKASAGTGTRGTFSASVLFATSRSGLGAVIVDEPSAKDGTPTNVVEVPVRMSH
jgi:hypothetical protein